MTLRNFPPADACDPEDLDNLADLVVRDPRASYDLAGSRGHIEALCRRYQALVQDLSETRETLATIAGGQRALQQGIIRLTEERDGLELARKNLAERVEFFAGRMEEFREERDDLRVRAQHDDAARTRLGDLTAECLDDRARAVNDLASAHTEIRALQSTLDAERNERQAEVLQADADRQRADAAEERVEQLTEQLDAMALLLDSQRETREANDRIQSAFSATCEAVTGKTIEQVNIELDEELAAHPDVGPMHHARDQREQEDTTP